MAGDGLKATDRHPLVKGDRLKRVAFFIADMQFSDSELVMPKQWRKHISRHAASASDDNPAHASCFFGGSWLQSTLIAIEDHSEQS